MQKLVTIYLNVFAHMPKGKIVLSPYWGGEKHGMVEEHLKDYLADGWIIESVCALGGGTGPEGWLAVVLQKS